MQVKGCCPLDCQDSCAWVAHVEGDHVARIEGAKDHPITRGVLCAKVRDYETRVTAADRLLHPLRRTGAKGSGKFEAISWEEALDAVAGRFKAIIAGHGAEALMPFHYLGSMGVVQRFALLRIFHALGASRAEGNVCGASASALLAAGHPMNVDPEETPDARLILLWGQNVLTTCHHQWHFIQEARASGARVIAIDPRATRTARMCDAHLAPVPGSDAILAAAIGRHLLESGRADLELAELWVGDLAAYRTMVAPWTFEYAARATGIEAARIAELAECFATASPALIRAGIAPQQAQNGEAFVRGLSAISILGGHWRRRGGGLSILSFPALNEAAVGRPDLVAGTPRTLDMARLAEILDPECRAPVKGLMVWSANPAVTQIDAPRLRRGLSREDLFTVVCDHFLTDTARFADIVLPATTQFEHFDLQGAWGHHYVTLNRPAIAPRGEAKSSGAIMRGLAARLGLDHPAFRESDEEIAASALPGGWTLGDLAEPNWRKSPLPRPEIAPLATRLQIADGALGAPPPPPTGHLQLLTPKSHYFLNSTFANMPRQQQSQGRPTVTMSVEDAEARTLAEGSIVVVRRGPAQINAILKVSDAVRPGILALEGKWWDGDDPAAVPMNRLTASAWSPAGQPTYNETYVTVEAL
jgi:anaerobic selenocysteine-containing dehydrogenase